MNGGILCDREIRYAIARGEIEIDPYDRAHVNPVSVDLTLGDEVLVYERWAEQLQPGEPPIGAEFHVLDIKEKPSTLMFKIPEKGLVLKPGIGYLMHTRERVFTRKFVPVLDGKSSIGRLFMVVHVTAGFGDPGFNGQYTLEVTVTHALRIYAGMRIAQMRFHTIVGEVERSYEGNYVGENARGPVASRAYRQFLPPEGL
jgi:dCTP deaminase